jgi:outer membrane protein OmpA-like peptidoglycan-associated protein
MKKLFIGVWLVAASVSSVAQSAVYAEQLKQDADAYYTDEQYNIAIQYYKQLSSFSGQKADVHYQLAESCRKTFAYAEAEAYYLKVYFQAPHEFPLALYYYALMLKFNGNFDESIHYFTEFIHLNQVKEMFREYIEQAIVDRAGSEMAKTEMLKDKNIYTLSAENINTDFNDYAPAVMDSSTLIITSGRLESNRQSIDERYGEGFTDNFYFTKSGTGWQDKTKQLFNVTNSRYNDGSGCFNGKGDKYYFTICGKDGPSCRIFLSERKGGKWTYPVALNTNINHKNFESKHPAVSKGGDTLLFSSNRSGGFGNYDIWMSIDSGNDNWGPVMNLGNTVNTKLNELAPSFTNFSHVFFLASDGHQNYGGMDLYMAKWFSTGVIGLYNLDYPLNSTRDDCFISVAADKIYYSSNREGGKGGFDIYSVPIPSVTSFISKLSLKNRDARADVKLNARTESSNNLNLLVARNEDRIDYENLTYEKKKIVNKMMANQIKGLAIKGEDYSDLVEVEYQLLKDIAQTHYKIYELQNKFANTYLAPVSFPVNSTEDFSISALLIDSLSGKALSFRKILLLNEFGEILKVTVTNESGKFRFTNIPTAINTHLRLDNLSYKKEETPRISNLKVESAERLHTYSFENIYFDFDQYLLRPEAKEVLMELIQFLKNYPLVQVEIFAYADDLGKDDYNMVLSEKRGKAVLDYLTSKGVDQTSLAVIAKGKQTNTGSNLEIQRQFDRRVEFYLNGATVASKQVVKTYILRKKCDWSLVSTATGVNIAQLKKLNAAVSDGLQIFQPVRIPIEAKEIPETLFFAIH